MSEVYEDEGWTLEINENGFTRAKLHRQIRGHTRVQISTFGKSAVVLLRLKAGSPASYNKILGYLFKLNKVISSCAIPDMSLQMRRDRVAII